MAGEYYTVAEILAEEKERTFARHWNCVGRASPRRGGRLLLRTVAGESLIILRDRGGGLRAFFNVCRHRGTRLCRDGDGTFSETIQCPYHAWTNTTDGRLIGAPTCRRSRVRQTRLPAPLSGARQTGGFLFVNIAAEPAIRRGFTPMLVDSSDIGLERARVGHSVTYEVAANWKLVFQNYSECLHCPMIHPSSRRCCRTRAARTISSKDLPRRLHGDGGARPKARR